MTEPLELRALIVDDEPLARVNVEVLLRRQRGWRVVGEAASGREALEELERVRADVLFLDIRMPGLNGLDLARTLATLHEPPLVVFATAFEQHALEAFEVEAVDYLIKPFVERRFAQTLRRLERRIQRRRDAASAGSQGTASRDLAAPPSEASGLRMEQQRVEKGKSLAEGAAGKSPAACLAVRSVGRVRLVEISSIQWIAAAGNYVRLYLAEACYLHRATLSSLERELDPSEFLRIHRSTMIQKAQVSELRTSVAGRYQVVLRDGTELEISQRFKQRVFAQLVGR